MWSGYDNAGHRGIFHFGKTEMHDILISIAVLTLSFAIAFSRGIGGALEDIQFFVVYTLPVAFLSVITAFFLHEMGHRVVARHYGCWSEFRMWTQGLIFALVTAFLGFVFAAPGAVYISGMITKRQNGMISAAGPLVNVIIAFIMIGIAVPASPMIAGVALFIAWINIFLAGFNLIPLPPLDGSKILAWGIVPYLVMVGLVAGAYIAFAQF